MLTRKPLTILVSGMIAAQPGHGGATWAVLQYLLGFRRLGHHVYFVEMLDTHGDTLAATANARYFTQTMLDFGFADRAALLAHNTRQTVGLEYANLVRVSKEADVLVNLSGRLTDPELIGPIPIRVYVDLDPGFTQVWHTQSIDLGFAQHTHFVTVGLSIGLPGCHVPTCDVQWLSSLQPIVLQSWPHDTPVTRDAFTSVANWRGYGSVEHDGVFYGQKAHSVRQYIDLPLLTAEQFHVALAIHPDERRDLAELGANHWVLLDPQRVCRSPRAYQQFVRTSKAELGMAKSGYVVARTGWFSDRSICYLACGRPVVAHDTGFSQFLPTGDGLLTFTTSEDARDGVDRVARDYAHHARRARTIAEEYFDSDAVLDRVLRLVGVS
jgi:hypothetical protein